MHNRRAQQCVLLATSTAGSEFLSSLFPQVKLWYIKKKLKYESGHGMSPKGPHGEGSSLVIETFWEVMGHSGRCHVMKGSGSIRTVPLKGPLGWPHALTFLFLLPAWHFLHFPTPCDSTSQWQRGQNILYGPF